MANLAAKAKGNNRMPLKRETPEGAYGRHVPRDLRDMAKAILLEPQFPGMNRAFPDYRIYIAGPSVYLPELHGQGHGVVAMYAYGNLSTDGRWLTNRSRERKGCLSRAIKFPRCKRGIAYGARALWLRSPHSSPRTGKPSTWRRGAGVQGAKIQRYAQCKKPT
jgi:hypothetical protein